MITLEQAGTIGTLVGVIVVAVMTKLDAYRADEARKSLVATVIVSDSNKTQKLNEIHALVNSGAGNTLRMVLALTKRIAEMEGATPADQVTAQLAQQAYDSHMAQQAKVDDSKISFDAGEQKGIARANAGIPQVDLSSSKVEPIQPAPPENKAKPI